MAGEYTSPFAIPLEHDSDQSAFTVFMVVVLAIWADHVRMRSPFIVLGLVLAAIGYGINISTAPIGVKYFGTFLSAIGGYSAFPATISWYVLHIKSLQLPSAKRQALMEHASRRVPNNVSGHYKRAVALGHVVIFGNIGGIVGGNVFRLQDQPRFLLGSESSTQTKPRSVSDYG